MEKDNLLFVISIIVSIAIASLLSLSFIWQLIIIAGLIGGFFNKTMKRGTLGGATGVGVFWLIYMVHGIITKNSNVLLDQFGEILIGTGYGWLIFLIVFLMGILYGALGGAIGSGIKNLLKPRLKKYIEEFIPSEKTKNSIKS